MREVYTTRVLASTAVPSKQRFWYGRVLEEDGEYYTQVVWWMNKGAIRESTPELAEPYTRHGGFVVDAKWVAIIRVDHEAEKLRRDKQYTDTAHEVPQ